MNNKQNNQKNQKFFDKTVAHLLKQKARSMAAINKRTPITGRCAYRGEGGRMCAIGCHIPRRLYRKGMEGVAVGSLLYEFPTVRRVFEGVDKDLMSALQRTHDSVLPKDWGEALRSIAIQYKLRWVGMRARRK